MHLCAYRYLAIEEALLKIILCSKSRSLSGCGTYSFRCRYFRILFIRWSWLVPVGLLNYPCLSNVQTHPSSLPQNFTSFVLLGFVGRFIVSLIRFAAPFEIQGRAYFIRRRSEGRRVRESAWEDGLVNIELAKWSKLQSPARLIFRKSPAAVDYLPFLLSSSFSFFLSFRLLLRFLPFLFLPLFVFSSPLSYSSSIVSFFRFDSSMLYLPLALAVNQAKRGVA